MIIRHDPERQIDLDLVRCTENAALCAWKWFGKGDKNKADYAAADSMRGMFQLVDVKGYVAIGEGRKDDAPGIFTGEKMGTWSDHAIPLAIAVDPIDGTTLTGKGLPGAISVIAAASCKTPDDDATKLFPSIPSYYMEKIAFGPTVREGPGKIKIDAPIDENLDVIAFKLKKRVRDVVAVVLDRPRHQHIIEGLRRAGCGIRLISDGDVAAAIAPCLPESGVDLYLGIGGSPEAVIASAAIKCLGGEMYSRMWPRDEEELTRLTTEEGVTEDDLKQVWTVDEMAKGDHVIFAATGISDSPMLQGIKHRGRHCITQSILVRARNRTVRIIDAFHDMDNKTVRLGSSGEEVRI
ncbi:MAG: class II fructose-bisphosphatase [Planctomycetes bacterium]|nr:class II fructose-bisphosphatase [Planctomycetota bacterium]NOG52999.1 class II fructose-bisphosphatase [Planctomycetota bacterium]